MAGFAFQKFVQMFKYRIIYKMNQLFKKKKIFINIYAFGMVCISQVYTTF